MAKSSRVPGEPADPAKPVCKACGMQIDTDAVLPFTADDGPGGKPEVFCPQCFCYERAPLEPERFYPGAYLPVKCVRCETVSVSIGPEHCVVCAGHHRNSTVIILPPVVKA